MLQNYLAASRFNALNKKAISQCDDVLMLIGYRNIVQDKHTALHTITTTAHCMVINPTFLIIGDM